MAKRTAPVSRGRAPVGMWPRLGLACAALLSVISCHALGEAARASSAGANIVDPESMYQYTARRLPERGTLTGDCEDEGVIAWERQRCNVAFDYSYQVTIDFAASTFAAEYRVECETSSPGLFAADRSRSIVALSLLTGDVLPDGRLFGSADQESSAAYWAEGQPVPPLAPETSTELMVIGFVNPDKPSLGLTMCAEDSIVGGSEALLASGWSEGFNPCSGGAEWTMVCEVETDF